MRKLFTSLACLAVVASCASTTHTLLIASGALPMSFTCNVAVIVWPVSASPRSTFSHGFAVLVLSPASSLESWTVLGDDDVPVAAIERYLAYLTDIERSPNTIKAYAHDLKDYFTFLGGRGLDQPPEERTTVAASATRAHAETGALDLDRDDGPASTRQRSRPPVERAPLLGIPGRLVERRLHDSERLHRALLTADPDSCWAVPQKVVGRFADDFHRESFVR